MGFLDRFRKQPSTPAVVPPRTSSGPRFAVVDVETTGLYAGIDRVVSLAIVTTDPVGRVLDEWTTLINPRRPMGATHIHGITGEHVIGAPLFADVVPDVTRRLAGAALVAHNASFDYRFLRDEFAYAGWELPDVPRLCTLEAADHHLPHLGRHRLEDCCFAIGSPLTGAHSALGDARGTAALLAAYMHPTQGRPPLRQHLELLDWAVEVSWPDRPTREPQPYAPPIWSMRESKPKPPVQALVSLVDRFSLGDALDEGAPEGSVAYLETLAGALEDGVITEHESQELASVADTMGLSEVDVRAANRAFVLALAHEALEDGKVSRAERAELLDVAELLGVDAKVVPALLDRAEIAREIRLSEDLRPLPEDWSLGKPLRVGDKVVITGCDSFDRSGLEERAEQLGIRVIGSVSPRVVLLVSDGIVDGTKAAAAAELGTRVVHPNEFKTLLEHLQPAMPREAKRIPGERAPKAETGAVSAAPVGGPNAPEIPAGVTPADVRAWGRENAWEVGVRGRLNRDLLVAFVVAHSAVEAGWD